MTSIRIAVALGATLCISNASAAVLSYDVIVTSNNWISSGGATPYGVAEQPTFNGTFQVDNTRLGSAALIDFNMVTGSQALTLAQINASSITFVGQGYVPGIGFDGQGYVSGLNLQGATSTGSFYLSSGASGFLQSAMGLADGTSNISCGNCVSFSPSTNTTTPLAPFSTQNLKVMGPVYPQGIYSLYNPEYALSFDGTAFTASFDLGFYGDDPGTGLINTWTMGIEDKWSNKYYIRDGNATYPLFIDANLSFNNPNADFQVEVSNEVGDISGNWPELRPDWDSWYTRLGKYTPYIQSPYALVYAQEEMAAHEFGHLLGIYDEYTSDPVNNKCVDTRPINELGVMGCSWEPSNGSLEFGPVQPRYFDYILSDISNITNRSVYGFMPVVPSFDHTGETFGTGESHVVSRNVPEPNSLLLIAIGFAALARKKAQKGSLNK